MSIPRLDWADHARDPARFSATLGRACRDTGFFLLDNHGIARTLIAQVFDAAARFFDQPDGAKHPFSIASNPHNRGWAYLGSESLDETSGQTDRKEAFNIGLDLPASDPRVIRGEPFRGVNLWPDLPGFRNAMLSYFDAALDLGTGLLRPIAHDLGLPAHHFDASFDAPMATLRLLSYPAASGAEDEIGAGAHTDYGALTLLLTDGAPGLQVRPRGGDWQDVPHVPGVFIVNIGDCLMRWTNDLYTSTPHRVLPPPRPRQSVAFFLDPNPDALIDPLPGTGAPKYAAMTGADYLQMRLSATYNL
ncbi:MAG: isopenicillin N synthase family dioxygenase [Roseinatronobacter sp.]